MPLLPFKKDPTTGVICVDRMMCLRQLKDTTLPSDSYIGVIAGQLLDSVREVDELLCLVPISQCRLDTICSERTISVNPLYIDALDVSFFAPLSGVTETLAYLLSKVINQRSQYRKFEIVAERGMKSDPKIVKYLQELCLCSLVGNYRSSDPSTRPNPPVRNLLYKLFRTPSPTGSPAPWFKMLLKKCRRVIMYCLREYLVCGVDSHPGMADQLNPIVKFSEFKIIVREAMSAIRNYMQCMLDDPSSSAYESAMNLEHESANGDTRWIQELSFLLQPFDSALLKISYRRPRLYFSQFALSVGLSPASQQSDQDADIPRLISKEEIDALRQLAERLGGSASTLLGKMIKHLPVFGVPKEYVALILSLMRHHYLGLSAHKRLSDVMIQLLQKNPRIFHLLLICSVISQDTARVGIAGHLPLNHTKAQILACQERFGMQPHKKGNDVIGGKLVLSHLFYFYYCDVCFAFYSCVADENSVYKQDYPFGERDAAVDHQTRQLYCTRDRHNYRGSCTDKPLRQILLLGNVIRYDNSLIQLCGQKNCGRIMAVSRNCITNKRGRACCYCSPKLQPNIVQFKTVMDYYTKFEVPRTCVVCSKQFNKTVDVYVYPFRVYVCKAHTSVEAVNHVNEFLRKREETSAGVTESQTREDMETLIRTIAGDRENRKSMSRVAGQKKKRELLSLIKQVTRSKK